MSIVRGISQAISNTHDGALDENGDPVVIGLRREEEVELSDKRIMDGFKVSFMGETLCIHYHSDVKLKEVHDNKFETNIMKNIESIASFIKKEYRKITKESLTLTKEGEADLQVQAASRVRSWVTAKCYYKLGHEGQLVKADDFTKKDTDYEKAFKDFIAQGSEDSKHNVEKTQGLFKESTDSEGQ